MIALFVLSSPIRQMQSSIYLQNYPALWKTVLLAPWVPRRDYQHKDIRTHITTAASNIWCCERTSLQMACLVALYNFMPLKHADTPSPSQISLKHGDLPGFKLYYWKSTTNNTAFASMVGLASDSPLWSTTWLGLDVIPGREQWSFILPL